jgi:soluble lytic murein transglycosylase-like protein
MACTTSAGLLLYRAHAKNQRTALLSITLKPAVACLALLGALHTGFAQGFCFDKASAKTGLPADLLMAIAKVESGMEPGAINKSHEQRTGTVDLGLMQINSGNLRRLKDQGVTRESLLADPCLNTMVGASILAEKIKKHGFDWNAVGAYNASCTQLKGSACSNARNTYAWRVYRALKGMKEPHSNGRREAQEAPQPAMRRPSIATIELAALSPVLSANVDHDTTQPLTNE